MKGTVWLARALVAATFPRAGPSSSYLLAINLALAATFIPVGVLVENLAGELVAVVGLAIQPVHISLWLRDREGITAMQRDL